MASPNAMTFYDFEPKQVNTASKCGFTPQYKGLEALYKDISASHPDRFLILGFPCNQFGSQEPGSNEEIGAFCERNYGVSFPIMAKVDVNGDAAEPLFTWLKGRLPGMLGLKRIKWNFEKFLVSADGRAVHRWSSITKPEGLKEVIIGEIEKGMKDSRDGKNQHEPPSKKRKAKDTSGEQK
ncbi:hypothetical protein KEM54_003757, partial [Ascosphaera aggregata]